MSQETSGRESVRDWVRTRTQRLRTLARLRIDVELRDPLMAPVYQRIGAQAAEMRRRGRPFRAIAEHFKVDDHTAAKAVRWFRAGS